MITKRNFFEQVKGFSEEYFLHLEDADLVRKLAKKGLTIQNIEQDLLNQTRQSHEHLLEIKGQSSYKFREENGVWIVTPPHY